MATFTPDVVEAAAGSGGPEFLFDMVGSEYLSATKIVFGADGVAGASWSFGAGAVDIGTGRVILASDDPAVASLAIIDDWDESDRAKVNLIVGQAGVTAGAGNVAANTPRVTLAADDPAVAQLVAIEGYLDTEVASILTAAEIIDDWDAAFPTHGAAAGSIVIQCGLEGRSTDPTAVDSGDAVRALATLLGKAVNYPYALPGSSWSYPGVSGGVTDTADDEAKAAAGAGSRNYVTRAQIINGSGSVSTEVLIKSGSTVLWRGWAQSIGGGVNPVFDPPLRGGDNEAINVANVTTSSKVYYNLQGFVSTE